ncbi:MULTISPECIES: Ger(x)C family spore germination protein [Metabacillus]|uniref:Ger(X)C family spore germination protein n=1 Tax=Metabacillus endolithicus TaxID=1535204 RepID=A0ABW5C4T1_9BACI|nr:Ger(x)C family spore germination protein [Metabacillus endolithicus]UPG62023.1 Ger(x)C family spore germination protein [Metabacillus endolithicus]
MNKKWIYLFLILSFFMTGCWDREELDEISIVSGIAVDPGEEKKYRMTVEAIISSEFGKQSAQGNAPVVTYTMEGNSLSELSNKMNKGLTRKLVFSHTRVLYISEEVARKGLFGFLDFLDRSGQFRNDFNIMITKGNPASDFTKITYPTQKSPSLKVNTQAETFTDEWGGDPNVKLYDFISSIISKGKNPVAASLVIKGNAEAGKTVENNKALDPEALVVMDGMVVFDEDKMVGSLSLEETRNYLWTQDLIQTSLSIPCGEDSEEAKDYFLDARITMSKSSLETNYKNGFPHIKVNINGEARIQGLHCPKDITKLDVFTDYEDLIEKHIEKEINSLITKVQEEYGVDIFGFGEALNRQHHKKFLEVQDRWDKEFTKAELDVYVDMHLMRSGIKNKSFNEDIEEKEE